MMMHVNRAFYIGDEGPDVGVSQNGDLCLTESTADNRTLDDSNHSQSHSHRIGWVRGLLSSQCGCGNTMLVRALGLLTVLLLSWLLLVVLLGAEALPGGGLFKLLMLVLVAELAGELVEMVGLPSILGMLIAGITLRTTDFYDVTGVYLDIVLTLREVSLGMILIKAGLGLDPVALLKLSLTVIRLAVCPGLAEAVTVAVMTYYILGYPWLWGFALGFLMCAISPAVVVPVLLKLKQEGYGESKGISTLVIAASSIDDVLAISVFSICISIIFSTGESLVSQMLQGPKDLLVGLTVGVLFGIVAGLTPHLEDDYLVWKRSAIVGAASLSAILGSPLIGMPGAGPLICIAGPFVASIIWSIQGWPVDTNPVEEVFSWVWTFMEPVLFSLIGAEIDLKQLDLNIIAWGVLVITAALVMRAVVCSLVLVGGKLNFKEVVFINLAWLPKATVQAALAPQVLDMVRKMADPNPVDLQRGSQFLSIAVLSILITAPLGAVGASLGGPRLLVKAPLDTNKSDSSQGLDDHQL